MPSERHALLALAVVASLLAACGPSPEQIAALTAAAASPTPPPTATPRPTATATFTPSPTPTATPIPYDVTLLVTDADGSPIPGASVAAAELAGAEPAVADEAGQVAWPGLDADQLTLSVDAQGYSPLEQTASLERGPNEVTVALERNPLELLPAEACQPGQDVLYLEDFEDGQAQGFEGVSRPVFTFDAVEGRGTVLTVNPAEGDGFAGNPDGVFGNAVWEFDFQTDTGRAILNWHQNPEAGNLRYLFAYWAGQGIDLHHFQNLGGNVDDRVMAQRGAAPVTPGAWQHIAFSFYDGAVDVWLNGRLILGADDPEPIEQGQFSLEIHEGWPGPVSFDNMVVCGLGAPYVAPPTATPAP